MFSCAYEQREGRNPKSVIPYAYNQSNQPDAAWENVVSPHIGGQSLLVAGKRKLQRMIDRMMQTIIPWIGGLAALLTSLSYIPQVQKALPRGSTSDLSLKMLIALTAGLVLWIIYGLLKSDWVIVAANGVGASLSASVLGFKIRDIRAGSA